MSTEELYTDLAIAEKNSKKNVNKRKIHFSLEVREAFIKNRVNSFFDLVYVDAKGAMRLRDLAVKEELL